MTNAVTVPSFDALMNPLLQALQSLGGSGTVGEILDKVALIANLTDEQLQVPHGDKGHSEVAYRLAWSRTYLKQYGLLENSARGVWSLTSEGRNAPAVDTRDVVRAVRSISKQPLDNQILSPEALLSGGDTEIAPAWREQLIEILLGMPPAAFERLTQRVLRESGFVQVEVTGRSGDGGIDGKGILRLGGLLSFQVIFQCKRYQGVRRTFDHP